MQKISLPERISSSAGSREENHLSTKRKHEFESLVTPHLNSLYNTAYRLTHNQNDAEDLIRDTLYKAFREFNHSRKNADFKLRIFRILINEYNTTCQKIAYELQNDCYDDVEEFYLHKKVDEYLSLDETAKKDFLEKLHEDDVKNALENLPDQLRLLVLLCDVEGFSYNEIAKIIDKPLKDIMSRLYTGRKLLQRYLWIYAKRKGYIFNEIE